MAKAYFVLMIHNEEQAIVPVVKSIMEAQLSGRFERCIIAVNDGSTDDSDKILRELQRSYPVTIISFETRQGMPLSFRKAFDHLRGIVHDDDVVFTLESDGTNNIACAQRMVEELDKGSDVVVASRYAVGAVAVGFPWYRTFGSHLINFFLRLLWNVPNIKDYSVLYRVYRGSILKTYISNLPPFRARKSFAVISEILLQISTLTSKFAEVPLSYDYNLKKGKSKMKLLQTLWEYVRITQRTPLHKQPIFWVAIVAFLMRIWGVTYGFPDLLAPDEPALTRGALTMLKLHTLIPAFHPADFATMYYPPVTAYIYAIVLIPIMAIGYLFSNAASLGAYASQLVFDPTLPWIATRVVSALIGAITVYFIGKLSEKMYAGSGVYSAIFLATSYLHVSFSHIARHWVMSVLLIVGLIWTAYYIYHSGQKRWYVLSGIFGGLSVGTGVVTGILMLAPVIAHLSRRESILEKIRNSVFWLMLAIAGAITALSFAVHPLILNNLLAGADNQGITLTANKSLYSFTEMVVVEMRDFVHSETMIFVFGLIGVSFFLTRNRKFCVILLLTIAISTLSLYLFHYYLLHYVLLVLPIFILFAGVGTYEMVRVARGRLMRSILILAIFILPTLVALRFSYLWTLPDTRHDARQYIMNNLPPEARIISDIPNMKIVPPRKEAIEARIKFDPTSSRIVDQALLALPDASYPSPAYNIFELATLSAEGSAKLTKHFLESNDFDFAIIDRFATPRPSLEALLASGEVIARFPIEGKAVDILRDTYGGPAMDVFTMRQMGPEVWIVKLAK